MQQASRSSPPASHPPHSCINLYQHHVHLLISHSPSACRLNFRKRCHEKHIMGYRIMYRTQETYGPKMTVKQSYLKVAERTGLRPDQVQVAFDSIMKLAAERMAKGEEFVIGDMISLKKTKGKRKTVTARCMHKLFVDAGLATVIPLPDSLDPTTIG